MANMQDLLSRRFEEKNQQYKQMDIVAVAQSLGMDLKRESGNVWHWTEHDSLKLYPNTNTFRWWSRETGGDPINLVETIQKELTGQEISYQEAARFLDTGQFNRVEVQAEVKPEPFRYYLEPYENPAFENGRKYLKEERGLSDETIDFFLASGNMTEATKKTGDYYEPVIVFKSRNEDGADVGASLQGIVKNDEVYPERGRLKQIMSHSDGLSGFNVAIGEPKRLIFAESPIDLMSYYELHKDQLEDVRLVSMEGLKKGVISHYTADLFTDGQFSQEMTRERVRNALDNLRDTTTLLQDNPNLITLAVDNDEAGQKFIDRLQGDNIPISVDIPNLPAGRDKMDWNDQLKLSKQVPDLEENPALYQPSPEDPFEELFNQGISSDAEVVYADVSGNLQETISQDAALTSGPRLQVAFRSSDENFLSEKYSSGEVVPYNIFVKDLYLENNKRLEVIEEPLVFPILHTTNQGGTWFDLLDENGKPLVDNFRYDVGEENQTISERLERTLPSDYLNIAQREDATFPRPELPSFNPDSGIPVDLYTGHQNFGTIDFNDLFNNSDFGSQADELGYGWAVNPKEMFAVIHGETLTQTQVDHIIDRMFKENISNQQLKSLLETDDFTLKDYAAGTDKRPDEQEKALDRSQELNNTGGELFNRNSSFLEAEASGTAPQPVEKNSQPDFPANVQSDSNTEFTSEQNKKERTYLYMGSSQSNETEGSATPELENSNSFERSVTSRPTISSHHLHFNINGEFKSIETRLEHSIDQADLNKLNRFSTSLHEAAQFYRNELADSKVSYFTSQGDVVQANFLKKNFMHLTGIKPIGNDQTPEKTLDDFANGGEVSYDDIRIGNNDSAFDKIKVLPDFPAVLDANSFYFDNLQSIDRYRDRFDSLIKSDDRDLMMIFRSTSDSFVPTSIFKTRAKLSRELEQAQKNSILGIYRERDGQIEQLSINEKYVKDGGKEMLETLKQIQANQQYRDEINKQNDLSKDSDGDGLTDGEEYARGTNPFSADSDGDGLTDGMEVSSGHDPLKPDNDFGRNVEISQMIRNGELKEVNAYLQEGMKDYFNSDTYKKYLEGMSNFNQYSSRNINMILKQLPTATMVAASGAWNKRNGLIKKGEKALYIITPGTKIKKKNGQPVIDPETGEPEKVVFFKKQAVFDVSQIRPMDGKELDLPKATAGIDRQLSKDDYNNYYRILKELSKENGVPIYFKEMEPQKGGYYDPTKNEIYLAKGRSPEHTLKTLIHEMAHSELHNNENIQKQFNGELTRTNAELQAESVAYVVSHHLGFDTGKGYSFGYLANWANEPDGLKNLEAQLEVVQQEASSLMNRIDDKMQKYLSIEQEKTVGEKKVAPKNAFYESLEKAKVNERSSTNSVFDQKRELDDSKKASRTMK
ncbi:PBECR4 domain-containing protein [Streptococcus sobrinus]|uniref:PBECR4 domain-containing protein n=2 Tax=Streptococcus sobrinus TaxID=1310 RepID=UPI00031FE86D|nr:PBECR4 domain-containing protein [Streptococcus sobrinus]